MWLFLRFSACYALALILALVLLVTLMFFAQNDWMQLLIGSGKPLAYLLLHVLPDAFWQGLTGLPGATEHPSVRSFLQLCVALAQLALLPALGFYRLWYRT